MSTKMPSARFEVYDTWGVAKAILKDVRAALYVVDLYGRWSTKQSNQPATIRNRSDGAILWAEGEDGDGIARYDYDQASKTVVERLEVIK